MVQIITAEARLKALHDRLKDGSITTEEMDEMVDLLGMCGCTLSGKSPNAFATRRATDHLIAPP
jgi:hypothetical protein